MANEEAFKLTNEILEPLAANILPQIFPQETFKLTSENEDMNEKIDIKNLNESFRGQVKTKEGENYHYAFSSNLEVNNNTCFIFYKKPLPRWYINKNLLGDLNACIRYLEGSEIYIVSTQYIKWLIENKIAFYVSKYDQWWIDDNKYIENYKDVFDTINCNKSINWVLTHIITKNDFNGIEKLKRDQNYE